MWREVPFLWTNWPGPSQMMRGAAIGDRWLRSAFVERTRFFPGRGNRGLRQWIINRLASKLSFPRTIQPWQSENDSLCDNFFVEFSQLNLISMQEGRTSVKFRSKARLIDNRCHWGETQIMHWKWISNGTNQISNTRLCYWLDWWGKCLLISAQLLA